jgi:hypothetical protein
MPPATLTNSQRAAVNASTAEPRLLIDFATKHGTYHFAQERLMWSGVMYEPRIINQPEITGVLGGVQGAGNIATKTMDLSIANADAWLSSQPPDFYRYGVVTAKEVLLDVESFALREFRFIAAGGAMDETGEQFTVQCEDYWTNIKRSLFPSNKTLITKQRFPGYSDLAFEDEERRENTPMNIPLGRVLAQLALIDSQALGVDSGALEWLIGYGHNITTAFSFSQSLYQYPSSAPDAALTSYAVESAQLRYRSTFDSVPFTSILVRPISEGDDARTTYLDTRQLRGNGYPDEFLLFMLTDSIAGAGMDATLIDSDSLLTARSFYQHNDLTYDAIVRQQRSVIDWLSDWSRDSLTHLVFRDKLYLVPQDSRSPVSSLHIGNILRGSLSHADVPVGQEESRVTCNYRERLQEKEQRQFVRYVVGSGADLTFDSLLIGRPTVAAKIAETIAKRAYYGIRQYQLDTTLRMAEIDEGDLVAFKHPLSANSNMEPFILEVEGTRRSPATGRLSLTMRETNYRVFQFGIAKGDGPPQVDRPCLDLLETISAPFSWGNVSSGVNDTIVLSHNLNGIVVAATYRYPGGTSPQRAHFAGFNTLYPWSLDLTDGRDVYNTQYTVPMRLIFPFSGYTSLNGSWFTSLTWGTVKFFITVDQDCAMEPPRSFGILPEPIFAVLSAWFSATRGGQITGTNNFIPFANRMWAIPFFVARSGTVVDGMGVMKLAGDQGIFRPGIYESISENDLYPGARLAQTSFSINSGATLGDGLGFRENSFSPIMLKGNMLYWLVTATASMAGAGDDFLAMDQIHYNFGQNNSADTTYGYFVSSFGAGPGLPATFPTNSVGYENRVPPALFYHVCS